MEVEVRHEVHLELEQLQELTLLVYNLFLRDSPVGNLFRYDLRVQWEHILVLGSQVHGDNAHQVDL